jgi:ribosomal protein S18 acetylase RimI-like enzyme
MTKIAVAAFDASRLEEASLLLAEFKNDQYGDIPSQEQCRTNLVALLDGGYAYALLAYADGVPAGFLSYSWAFSTSRGLPILRIQDVFTAAVARRQGVGQALLQHCADIGRANGAHRLQLETDTDNEAARPLYEKAGFQWISHKEVYMQPLHAWKSQEEDNG